MPPRQPLAARVWGPSYRTWWWAPGGRNKKKAKRRSARRERAQARQEIRSGGRLRSTTWGIAVSWRSRE